MAEQKYKRKETEYNGKRYTVILECLGGCLAVSKHDSDPTQPKQIVWVPKKPVEMEDETDT